jgi:hypothetical protein
MLPVIFSYLSFKYIPGAKKINLKYYKYSQSIAKSAKLQNCTDKTAYDVMQCMILYLCVRTEENVYLGERSVYQGETGVVRICRRTSY